MMGIVIGLVLFVIGITVVGAAYQEGKYDGFIEGSTGKNTDSTVV